MNPFLRLFQQYRPIIILAASGLCAIIATSLIWGQFSDRVRTLEAQAREQEQSRVELLVAARRISAGQTLVEADVKLVEFPLNVAPTSHFTDLAEVVGLHSRWPIAEGEPLTGDKVLSTNQGGLAMLIPEEKRAVTIGVDRITGLERFLVPGSRVDVLAVLEDEDGTSTQVETLLQGVEVLAIADSFDLTPEEREEDEFLDRSVDQQSSTVTLAVEPDEAARLVLALNNGTVQLAMRNYADAVRLDVGSVRRDDLLGGFAAAGISGDADGPAFTSGFGGEPQYVVEVYRGAQRSQQIFEYD